MRLQILGLILLMLFVGTMPALADGFIFTFDENGNGTIAIGSDPLQIFLGALMPDPSQLGNPLVLTWDLASVGVAPVGRGDVSILDADDNLVDVLRFTDATGSVQIGTLADRMIFYSIPGGGALADTGFPLNLNSGIQGSIHEIADDTFEFVASGPNTYDGVPNLAPVPEPSGWILLTTLTAAVGYFRRKSSKALAS